jgi:hypothetical protein
MKKRDARARFETFIDRTCGYGPAGDCWKWTGATDHVGHGRFQIYGRTVGAHRFAFTIFKFAPDGSQVLHTCDMRDCVNPSHLYLGTQADNVADRERFRYRHRWPAAAKAPTEKPRKDSPLTPAMAKAIFLDPRPQSTIARDYGVSQPTVSTIKTRRYWASATKEN